MWQRSSAVLSALRTPDAPRSSFGRTEGARPLSEDSSEPKCNASLHHSFPTFPSFSFAITMSVELAGTPTNARSLKRQRASDASSTTTALQCQVCHRSYERADHLNRHLDSREHLEEVAQHIADLAQTGTNAPSAARNVPPHLTDGICSSDTKLRMQKTLQMALSVPIGSRNARRKLATPA